MISRYGSFTSRVVHNPRISPSIRKRKNISGGTWAVMKGGQGGREGGQGRREGREEGRGEKNRWMSHVLTCLLDRGYHTPSLDTSSLGPHLLHVSVGVDAFRLVYQLLLLPLLKVLVGVLPLGSAST